MSVRWKTIVNRLHPETGLKDKDNQVSKIFDPVIGESLDNFNEYIDISVQNRFLLTATGKYLDKIGEDHSMPRVSGETDNEYRQRILNRMDQKLTVRYCKNRGLMLWSIKGINSNIRDQLSSINTYTSAQYVAIPRNTSGEKFLKNSLIWNHIIQIYQQGWK